jgi:carbon-monoxide dehydrogenase medium subunit
MKAAPFDYAAIADSAEAIRALGSSGPLTKVAAGCQSLAPMLNLRLARPERLIDVSRAIDMRRTIDEDDALVYGGAVTHAEIEDGVAPDATPGWMASIARGIAYRAVRNRGTIGGSLAHADPAADWVVTLIALGADVLLRSKAGARTLPLSQFITGALATALKDGEIVTGVRVPKRESGARWGYWKFVRKQGEFAKASASVLIDRARNETRIVIGAIERAPLAVPDPHALLTGQVSHLAALERLLPGRPPGALVFHAAALRRAIAVTQGETAEAAGS